MIKSKYSTIKQKKISIPYRTTKSEGRTGGEEIFFFFFARVEGDFWLLIFYEGRKNGWQHWMGGRLLVANFSWRWKGCWFFLKMKGWKVESWRMAVEFLWRSEGRMLDCYDFEVAKSCIGYMIPCMSERCGSQLENWLP